MVFSPVGPAGPFRRSDRRKAGQAYHLLRRAAAARTFEPQTCYTLAHCLEHAGQADLALVYYELAHGVCVNGRPNDLADVIGPDYRRFLRRVAEGRMPSTLGEFARARLASFGPAGPQDTAELVAIILWNTDGTDVDLHVTEPSGEECFYSHQHTASGGHMTRDITTGYGPEMYVQPRGAPGSYSIRAHYFAADANRDSSRTKVFAMIYRGWGSAGEQVACRALTLSGRSEIHELAGVTIAGQDKRQRKNPFPTINDDY